MLGHRSSQLGMFIADQKHLRLVGEGSFYGSLARHGRSISKDDLATAVAGERARALHAGA